MGAFAEGGVPGEEPRFEVKFIRISLHVLGLTCLEGVHLDAAGRAMVRKAMNVCKITYVKGYSEMVRIRELITKV